MNSTFNVCAASINTLFKGIFDSELSKTIGVLPFLVCLGVALILGTVIAASYTVRSRYTKSFVFTLAVLPAIVCVVIMMVNGNIGAGVAVAGAFSLVRFRSAAGSAKEIVCIFLAMGTGLIVGMGYLAYTVLFTVTMCAIFIIFNYLSQLKGKSSGRFRDLKVIIPESLNYTDVFEDIFSEYTSHNELIKVKTVNMGSLYSLRYSITLKDPKKEKELIDKMPKRKFGNIGLKTRFRNIRAVIINGGYPMNSKTDKRAFLAGALLALLTVLTLASCSMTDSNPQAHEHRYSDVFSYDESGHWKSAVCGCNNETEDYGKHSFSVAKTVSATFDFGGYTEYTCSICGYSKQDDITSRSEHSYSSQWTYSSQSHWQEYTDKGYEELVRDFGNHVLAEKVIKSPTQTESGLSSFTCNVCGYSYESVVPKTALVISAPSVPSGVYYIGQSLSSIPLVGGEGSVAGSFAWTDPTALLTRSDNYEVTFTPDSDENSPVKLSVSANAVQLTVSIEYGENGSSDKNGVINVSYDQTLDISFIPNVGYAVSSVSVNGKAADVDTNFTLEDIRENKNIRVEFKSIENSVEIDCLLGSPDCYTVSNSVLTISGITADTVYSISGEMYGSIVIDVGSAYSFEFEMNGFTIYSNVAAPISVLSGDKVTVSAKKGYVNRIYDTRRCESTEYPAAIYSLTDLDVEGKGELILNSDENGGVYSKKDLNVKNLTLSVKCRDNALRGNDSVTVTHGSITLIATDGDAIKTTNSNISSKGKQRGDVRITDSAVKIYAADDGIDAEHDVIIYGDTTTVNIFTGAFSEYSSTVASTRTDTLYVKLESRDYSCSVKYADSTGNVVWSSSDTVTERTVDGKTCFFYSFPAKADCKKISVYLYKTSQQIGQDKEFHAVLPTSKCTPMPM